MSQPVENPFRSPQAIDSRRSATPNGDAADGRRQLDYRTVLRRWEVLRIAYNLAVGLAGAPLLLTLPWEVLPEAVIGAAVYALLANVLYLLGPITELYLNWFVDAWQGRLVPRWLAAFVRSAYLRALIFTAGLLFSMGLTLAVGGSLLLAAALPNQ